MFLTKNKKISSLLVGTLLTFGGLLALTVAAPTASAQTPEVCTKEQSVRAIENCVNRVNERIAQDCKEGTDQEKERCAANIRSGQAGGEDAIVNPFDKSSSGDVAKQCGKGDSTYIPVIDIGCQGEDYRGEQLNPIMDMLFALLRFLTMGVGIVAIASVIIAGIQFTASQGDSGATAKAISRIATTVGALFLYLVAWALLNWLVPGGVFNG